MSNLRRIFLFFAFHFAFFSAFAQIEPPDFICVQSDTLFWSPVSNPCGPFEAYEIYFSNNLDGPYSLLARITDPGETSFFHINPSSAQFFYYLLSDHDCPGLTQIPSDTFDNRSPVIPSMKSVSVQGNNVLLSWSLSPSPEVTAYVIYRRTPIGTIAIDTVYNDTTYLDTGGNPTAQSETYFVVAVDACENTSLFDLPHNTVLVSTLVSECEQIILLEWNQYENWQNGIERQEIWVSIDGGPYTLTGMAPSTESSFIYENANEGTNYCFQVRSFESITGYSSNSAEVCVVPEIVQPMRNLVITNVSFNSSGAMDIEWIWDENAEITDAFLEHYREGDDITRTERLPLVFPLNHNNVTVFSDPRLMDSPWRFSIYTVDECDSMKRSEQVSPVFLTVGPTTGRTNFLQWKPLEIPGATVLKYTVNRLENGIAQPIAMVDGNTLTYEDPVDAEDPDQTSICYFIEANFTLTLPDGSAINPVSVSNTACADQPATIYVPNAFAPRGINTVFRPVIVFGTSAEYRMQIFNRWGQILFETADQNEGWDGKYKGKDAPQGIYTYFIRLRQPDGNLVEKTGNLMLVR